MSIRRGRPRKWETCIIPLGNRLRGFRLLPGGRPSSDRNASLGTAWRPDLGSAGRTTRLLLRYRFARTADKEYLPLTPHAEQRYSRRRAERDGLAMSVTGTGLGTSMRACQVLTIAVLAAHEDSVREG